MHNCGIFVLGHNNPLINSQLANSGIFILGHNNCGIFVLGHNNPLINSQLTNSGIFILGHNNCGTFVLGHNNPLINLQLTKKHKIYKKGALLLLAERDSERHELTDFQNSIHVKFSNFKK